MASEKSMFPVVLALALGSFAIGTSEFAAMGLLPWYASDLGVSETQAGYVISAYAIGVVVGAPITSVFGARLPRRSYLAGLIAFYGVMNLLAAILPGYSNLVWSRFVAGLPHGGFLGVAMLFAADALPRAQRAKGVTQVMLGLTVANIVGVPVAGALGQLLGWRFGFALPGGLALLSALLIFALAPKVAADPDARPMEELRVMKNPYVILTLLVGVVGSGGMFAVYAYLSAAMLATAEPPVWAVPVMLSLYGIGSTVGSIWSARLTVKFGAIRTCVGMMALAILMQGFAAYAIGSWQMMVLSSFMIGLAQIFVPLQTRLMDVAGKAQSMASAMNHAAFNAANALGPWLAGMGLAAHWGWSSSGVIAMGLSAAGLLMLGIVVFYDRRTGYVPETSMRVEHSH